MPPITTTAYPPPGLPYYLLPCCGGQAVTLAEGRSYNVGTALVYLIRAGRKPGNSELDDIIKARDHLNYEIARLEAAAR